MYSYHDKATRLPRSVTLKTVGGRELEVSVDFQDDRWDIEFRVYDGTNEHPAILLPQDEILLLRKFLDQNATLTKGGLPKKIKGGLL